MPKHKSQAKTADAVRTMSATPTERLMAQIAGLYESDKDGKRPGILEMAEDVGVVLQKPRRKVTVMLIGNHSAGKSSFINWYIGEAIQNTGVAIETKGFTFVTRGNKSQHLKGPQTIMLYPHLQSLADSHGEALIQYMQTAISVSRARMFPMVDFIDSPGLVDGEVTYHFEVNDVIIDMASHCDLVMCFMDPMGQALSTRTMNVVQRLNEDKTLALKTKYYLSKADTAKSPSDLNKVMNQLVLNIGKYLKHDLHGFTVPTIFIPSEKDDDGANDKRSYFKDCNEIGQLCQRINDTIENKVQDDLNALKSHLNQISAASEVALEAEAKKAAAASCRNRTSWLMFLLAWTIVLAGFLVALAHFKGSLPKAIKDNEQVHDFLYETLTPVVEPLVPLIAGDDIKDSFKSVGILVGVYLFMILVSKFFASSARSYKLRTKKQLKAVKSYKKETDKLLKRHQEMMEAFVSDCKDVDQA